MHHKVYVFFFQIPKPSVRIVMFALENTVNNNKKDSVCALLTLSNGNI